MKLFALFACASTLANLTSAAPASSSAATRTPAPLPPSQDPWYTAPPNFASYSPGTVLRSRSAPGNLTTIFNASSAVYNILYRSTNSLYQPSWAVTTVFIPKNRTKSSNTSSLLSYQIPYNTADMDHSPSYDLRTLLGSGLVLSDIQTALSYGWIVNVPDFEGPTASFASGVQEGHAVIDSIRAALATNSSVELSPDDTTVALWGYSGGSLASEWAAEVQVQYAPELNISGVALGGLIPNGTDFINAIDGTPAAGLIPSVLVGLTEQAPDAYAALVEELKTSGTYNATNFLAVGNYSYFQAAVSFANQSIFNYFESGIGVLNNQAIRDVFDSNAYMGYHGTPQMPMYIYKAVHDEYAPIEYVDLLVDRYCGVGASILYQRNTVGNHLDEETNGDADALAWLQSVFDGVFHQEGCIVQNVTIALSVHGPFASPPQNSG